MPNSLTLFEVSKALAQQLWNALKDDPQTNTIVNNQSLITLSSPKIAAGGREKLSVFLFSVAPAPANKNVSPVVNEQAEQTKQVGYTARYLITPVTGDAEHDLLLLDKIIQALAGNPFIEINVGKDSNSLRITQDILSLGDLTQLWMALGEPLRSSAGFTVTFGEAASMPQAQLAPAATTANANVMQLYRKVFDTFEQQVNDWRNRNLFQKQYVQSDFAKSTGMTVDAMRSELRDLGDKLETARPIKPYMEALKKLEEFYKHQQSMLKGFAKVQKKRQEGIDMVAKWKNDVAALIEALKTYQ